jgi:hypothetical protein
MQVTAICCQINLVLWNEGMQVPPTNKKWRIVAVQLGKLGTASMQPWSIGACQERHSKYK